MVPVKKHTEYIGKVPVFFREIDSSYKWELVICIMLYNHHPGVTWCSLSICVMQENKCHEMFSSQEQCYVMLHYNRKLSNHHYPLYLWLVYQCVSSSLCLLSLLLVCTPWLKCLICLLLWCTALSVKWSSTKNCRFVILFLI